MKHKAKLGQQAKEFSKPYKPPEGNFAEFRASVVSTAFLFEVVQ